MTEPCTCPVIDCPNEDLYETYSLQDDIYPVLLICPSGFPCDIPDVPVLYLVCCDGSVVSGVVPPMATRTDRINVYKSLVAKCAKQSNCPKRRDGAYWLYLNEEQCCTKYCPDGSPFRYCVPRGTVSGFSQDEADAIARNIACEQANLNRVCMGVKDNICCVNTAMNAEVVASTDVPGAFQWTMVGGTLPAGVTFNSANSITKKIHISGTPTIGGNYTITVRCQSLVTGSYMERSVVLSVIEITPAVMPSASIGVPYAEAIVVIGIPPGMTPTYYITSGTLPTGLDLYPGGEIIGTPTGNIPATFTLKVSIWA